MQEKVNFYTYEENYMVKKSLQVEHMENITNLLFVQFFIYMKHLHYSPKQNRLSTRDRFSCINTKFLAYRFSVGHHYIRDRDVNRAVWYSWLTGTTQRRAVTWATMVSLHLGTMISLFGPNCRAVLRSNQSVRNVLTACYTRIKLTRLLQSSKYSPTSGLTYERDTGKFNL